MRRISGVLLIVFMLVFLVYSNGLAALYSQTEVPEDSSFLRFEFLAVESSDGTDGFVTVEARGDYFERGEGIDLYIEGNDTTAKFAVEGIYFSMGDPQIIQWVDNGDPDDVWWTNTWTIPGATMASIVNDDNNISVNFVDLFWNYDVGGPPEGSEFVTLTVEYNVVPIPGSLSLLLLGGGVVGFIGIRRRVRR